MFVPARPPLAAIGLCVLLVLAPGRADATPVTFSNALPVAEGETIVRTQGVVARSDAGGAAASPRGDRIRAAVITTLVYGLRADLALFASLPLVLSHAEDGRGTAGAGDLRVFARYTLFREDGPGRTLRAGVFGGFETPTGADNRRSRGVRLPADLQPGSASWDGFGGIVLTYQSLDYGLDAQASYFHHGPGAATGRGDVLAVDGAVTVRLWPPSVSLGGAFVNAVVELNYARESPGRDLLFVTPALQYVTRRWVVEGGVQLPAVESGGPTGVDRGSVFRLGVRVNF